MGDRGSTIRLEERSECKAPKKGDLSECGNWRGITLLPIALKIFSRILLNRLEPMIEDILRDEQAGFREGRKCNDQIFIVRYLMQQANEMKVSLTLKAQESFRKDAT